MTKEQLIRVCKSDIEDAKILLSENYGTDEDKEILHRILKRRAKLIHDLETGKINP